MEELFRFILTRPAQRVDPDTHTVKVRPSADYYGQLKKARASAESRAILKRLALAQRQSAQALTSVDDLTYARPLKGLLKDLAQRADMSLDELRTLIKKLFDTSANVVVTSHEFGQDRERLSDVLVTNAILGSDGFVSSD